MRINIFGGPGIGKSATAAWLFSELKQRDINVELVTEYAKTWAWEKRKIACYDQVYIFGKQLRAEDRLLRQGVHVVTDSPLMLQLCYAFRDHAPFAADLLSICLRFEEEHPVTNIVLARTDRPYIQTGRYETLEEARNVDGMVEAMLINTNRPFVKVAADQRDVLLATTLKAFEAK